jgi:hypothetical protein
MGMTDAATQAACLRVSRGMRASAQEYCYLFDDRQVVVRDIVGPRQEWMLNTVEFAPQDLSDKPYARMFGKYYMCRCQMPDRSDEEDSRVIDFGRWIPTISSTLGSSGPPRFTVLPEAAFRLLSADQSFT